MSAVRLFAVFHEEGVSQFVSCTKPSLVGTCSYNENLWIPREYSFRAKELCNDDD